MMLFAVIGLPFLLSALLALPVGRWLSKDTQTWLLTGIMAALFGVLVSYYPQVHHDGAVMSPSIVLLSDIGLAFSVYLDGLALLFGLVVTGIGTVILLYTGYYFDDHAKQTRFNMWLLAFAGAMLGVVLSGNLLMVFVMWELTSITSFMLIGFYGDKDENARVSSMRALVITGGGGLALGAGVLLIGVMGAQITETDGLLLNFADLFALDTLTTQPLYIAAATLIMLGAFTKSAQFPFHFWLPGAMTAPTPASSFLHSATMVKAGIYLLARLHPLFYDHPFWVNTVVSVGLLTMLISAIFALKQRDLKGLLAYSTTSWLGVLVALTGLPSYAGFKALAIGILAHALYKSALFLAVGSIDHSFHTRILDELGGVWQYMKGTAVVVIISALSMAGIPLLFGFVAKEVLLDAALHYMNETYLGSFAVWGVMIAASLNGTAGYMLIWDVFFAKPKHELHYHAMPHMATVGPLLLAIGGTFTLPFLLEPLIVPLVETVTPKTFELHLIPAWGIEFQLSLTAIAAGFAVFLVRRVLIGQWSFLPFNGAQLYAGFISGLDATAKIFTRLQNGKVRYYLFYILGVAAAMLVFPPLQWDILRDAVFIPQQLDGFSRGDILTTALLILAVVTALASVFLRKHLYAALSVSVFGYAVAAIYVVSFAPDVALVQFLVETLSTVLIIVMISRIDADKRANVIEDIRTEVKRPGVIRDLFISLTIGVVVMAFVLTAMADRPVRVTIAEWYITHTYEEIGIRDVVAAIVTDFRGMDTFIEITVFAVAGLGVLALLPTRIHRADIQSDGEKYTEDLPLFTPFTRTAAYLVFPLALLLAFVHLFYGGDAPGDGFTAGVVSGLALTLGYVVFGYVEMERRVRWLEPKYFVVGGLMLSVANAVFPLLIGREWLAHLVVKDFSLAGIHVASSLVFEVAIALAVFGGVGLIMESIAHPEDDTHFMPGDDAYQPPKQEDKTQ